MLHSHQNAAQRIIVSCQIAADDCNHRFSSWAVWKSLKFGVFSNEFQFVTFLVILVHGSMQLEHVYTLSLYAMCSLVAQKQFLLLAACSWHTNSAKSLTINYFVAKSRRRLVENVVVCAHMLQQFFIAALPFRHLAPQAMVWLALSCQIHTYLGDCEMCAAFSQCWFETFAQMQLLY